MAHICNETCSKVSFVRRRLKEGKTIEWVAAKLQLSRSRILELQGNYNWRSDLARKQRICDHESFD